MNRVGNRTIIRCSTAISVITVKSHNDLGTWHQKRTGRNLLKRSPADREVHLGVVTLIDFLGASQLMLESTPAVEMIDWVYECEKPDGGFGVSPEAPADALHTTSALLMLRAVGRRPRYAPTIHERWIRRSMRRCLRPPGPLPEAARLDAMSQLLRAHGSLPEQIPLPTRLPKLIAEESIGWWRRTRRTTRDTRHLVQIIQHFDTHDPNVYDEVLHTWLPGQERSLPSLKPAAALPEARDLVWILRLLFPDSYRERDTVVQLRDNLIKDYRHRGSRKKPRPSFGVTRRPTE